MTSNTPQTTPGKRRRLPEVPSPDDPTLGKLFADASRDLSALVRSEIQLAKSELKVSIKTGGTGLGLFAGAAFIAVLAIIMLSVALAYFLSMTGLHLAWCFLIVFTFYLVLAGMLAFVGVQKVKKVRAPERAIHQAQESAALLKRS